MEPLRDRIGFSGILKLTPALSINSNWVSKLLFKIVAVIAWSIWVFKRETFVLWIFLWFNWVNWLIWVEKFLCRWFYPFSGLIMPGYKICSLLFDSPLRAIRSFLSSLLFTIFETTDFCFTEFMLTRYLVVSSRFFKASMASFCDKNWGSR